MQSEALGIALSPILAPHSSKRNNHLINKALMGKIFQKKG